MTGFSIGQVYQFTSEACLSRLIWLASGQRGAWFCDITSETAVPIFYSQSELAELDSQGLIKAVEDPWLGKCAPITDVQVQRRDEAWEAIAPIVLAQPDCFHPKLRAKLTEEQIQQTGYTRQKIYRLLRRWWQRGMMIDALTPDYGNSGAPGKPRQITTTKRGRPSEFGQIGVNIDGDIRVKFRESVMRYWAQNKRIDQTECYHKCLEDHFTDLIFDEKIGRQRSVLRPDHPTIWQFRYWLRKDNDLFAMIVSHCMV